MSVRTHVNIANPLSSALRSAKPRLAQQGIDKANENLRAMSGECAGYVDALLTSLEATLAASGNHLDDASLTALYQQSMPIIGVASVANLPDLDAAARSLCDVVDGLIVRQLHDRSPVEVHVRAMRLLRTPDALAGGAPDIVAGLLRVRERFAASARSAPEQPGPPAA